MKASLANRLRELECRLDNTETLAAKVFSGSMFVTEKLSVQKIIKKSRHVIHEIRLYGFSLDRDSQLGQLETAIKLIETEMIMKSLSY